MPTGIYQHKKGWKHTEETKQKIGLANLGKKYTEETKKKMKGGNSGSFKNGHIQLPNAGFQKGHPNYLKPYAERLIVKCGICEKKYEILKSALKFGQGKFCSMKCRNKNLSLQIISEETRKKLSEANKGEKAPNWQGCLTSKNLTIRASSEYRLWRESVFKRDSWTCVWCNQRGVRLNADHIKPFSLFPDLRFAIDNGRTLCVDCHRKTDTYGTKVFKFKQNEIVASA